MDIWMDVRVRMGRILGIVEFWQSVLVWDSERGLELGAVGVHFSLGLGRISLIVSRYNEYKGIGISGDNARRIFDKTK